MPQSFFHIGKYSNPTLISKSLKGNWGICTKMIGCCAVTSAIRSGEDPKEMAQTSWSTTGMQNLVFKSYLTDEHCAISYGVESVVDEHLVLLIRNPSLESITWLNCNVMKIMFPLGRSIQCQRFMAVRGQKPPTQEGLKVQRSLHFEFLHNKTSHVYFNMKCNYKWGKITW